MVKKKAYSGYKSFSYLEPGKDFKVIGLAKEINRVEPYKVPLNNNEEDRVEEIMEKNICISLHDHTDIHPEDLSRIMEWIRQNRISTGYEGLSLSGLDAVFDGLMDGTNLVLSSKPWRWESLIYEIGMRMSDIDHQDFLIRCFGVKDIEYAHKNGRLAFIPHIEGAGPIENDVDRVDILYGLGVRCMGLVYSEQNYIGTGLREKGDGGLTYFGYDVVDRMNKIGMAIDLAHVGDKTSIDAIHASSKPVLITHAGARKLWNSKRMKPDEVIQAIADKKGVFGIEAAPHTTLTMKHREHSLESVMEHFQYIEKLVGIDYVGFGPDTLFGDHVGVHHAFTGELSIKQMDTEKYNEVPYVKGIENPSEFPNIVRWLVKNGYSDREISKVIGGNALRALKQIWFK